MDHLFLSKTLLFRGISPDELRELFSCLQARTQIYPRGAVIYRAGDSVTALGMVLSGSVSIENDDGLLLTPR